MKAILAVLLLIPAALVTQAPTAATATAPAPTAARAEHTLAITGTGITTYPAFSSGTERYGITSTESSTGTVNVKATTSDRAGELFINGRLAPNGKRTVTGLEPNDEISVIFKDSRGTSAHSAIYLPGGFPEIVRTTPQTAGLADGLVLLTLSAWTPNAKSYEAAVDRNGVPTWTKTSDRSTLDFKRQPNGTLTTSRAEAADNVFAGSPVVELDARLEPNGTTHKTVGLVNTDGHDSILTQDGSTVLLSYEHNPATTRTDSIVQEIDAQGTVVFEWSSEAFASEAVVDPSVADYAHVNSVQIMRDGDFLVSFRHLSSVYKIARTAHNGFAEGEVVWKLGGRDSDFSFPDRGGRSPCAQHTASETADGHILIYDNGSGGVSAPMCVDPANPTGPSVTRTRTWLTEYDVTSIPGQAQVAWEWSDTKPYAIFAGGTERLANGHTLVGWAAARKSMASEIADDGTLLWDIRDAAPIDQRKFTYRAQLAEIPDAIDPVASLAMEDGQTYIADQAVRPEFSCTDRGGSNLQVCAATGLVGDRLDTSTTGTHTVTLSATDGAGNSSAVTRSYKVLPRSRPDATIRKPGTTRYVGTNVYGPALPGQRVNLPIKRARQSRSTPVRVKNNNPVADRFRIKGARGNTKFRVAYIVAGKDVTRRVLAGQYRSPSVRPGSYWKMRVKVTRTVKARKGNRRTLRIRALSGSKPVRDSVALRAKAK